MIVNEFAVLGVMGIGFLLFTLILIVVAFLPPKILHNIARTMLLLELNFIVQFVLGIIFSDLFTDMGTTLGGLIMTPVLLAGVLAIWKISTPKTRKNFYIACGIAFLLFVGITFAIIYSFGITPMTAGYTRDQSL